MDEFQKLSALIADLYDAATNNTSFWPLGARIAAALESESCSFNLLNGRGGPVEPLSWTENCVASVPAYNAYYHRLDIWAAEGAKQPPGIMVATEDFISPGAFLKTEFYQDYCRPFGMFRALGAVIPLDLGSNVNGMISIHRNEREASFSETTKRHGTYLLTHIRQALQLRERLGHLELQNNALLAATGLVGLAVFVVSANARLLFTNPEAEALLRKNDLRVEQGCLVALQSVMTDALHRSIAAAVATAQGQNGRGSDGTMQITGQDGVKFMLSIYPLPTGLGSVSSAPSALILASDPQAGSISKRKALARAYGLTRAEEKLYQALLAGERLKDYAARTGISVATARSQLSAILEKSGCARQIDLIRQAAI